MLGAPGYLIALIPSLIIMGTLSLGRVTTNTINTALKLWVSAANLVLHTNDGIAENYGLKWDFRDWKQQVLGAPGFVIAAIPALITMGTLGFGRIVTNSLKTMFKVMASSANFILHKDDEFSQNYGISGDTREFKQKMLGAPGYLIALIPSFIIMGTLSLGRAITNTFKTALMLWVSAANLVLHSNDEIAENYGLTSDLRDWKQKALGAPGFVIAAIPALITMGTLGFGRIVTNSVKTSLRLLVSGSNLVLHEDDKILKKYGIGKDQRLVKQLVLGAPGYIITAIPALVLIGTLGFGRIVTNSLKTTFMLWVTSTNLVLHKDDEIPENLGIQWDFAREFKQKTLGLPGFLVALPVVIVTMGILSLGRIITNSIKTTIRLLVSASNQVLHENDAIFQDYGIQSDPRLLKQLILGMPAFLIAPIPGFFIMGIIGLGRIISNSFNTAVKFWVSVTNLVLPNKGKLPEELGIGADNARNFNQKVLGSPGFLIAALPAFLTVGTILSIRFVSQNLKSFRALSSSLLNIATERALFNTTSVGADERSGWTKVVGGLGYIAAAGITGAVGSLILVVRKIPNVFAIIIGLIGTIGILPAKMFFGKDPIKKFETNSNNLSDNEVDVIQSFKDINSALTWDGQLVPGNSINQGQSGAKPNAAFARKCITLNAKSVTEQTLDDLLEAYKLSNDKANFFTSYAFHAAVNKIQEDHYGNDCLTTGKEYRESTEEVNAVASFVKDYMEKKVGQEMTEKRVPADLYKKCRSSYSSLFWAKPDSNLIDDDGASPAPSGS